MKLPQKDNLIMATIPMLSVLTFFPSLVWLVLGEERGGAVLHLPRYDRVGSWWEGLGAG